MNKIIPGSARINNLHDDGSGNIMDENNNTVNTIDYTTGIITSIEDIPINSETGEPYFKIQEEWAKGWKDV